MGNISDAAFEQGDVMRRITTLGDAVKRLQTVRTLESAAVGRGGLRVHDGGGLRVEGGGNVAVFGGGDVRVGDGGNIVVDGGQLHQRVGENFVPLAALAGGAEADTVPDEESLTASAGSSTGYEDLDTVGPAVSFTTWTGKWIVLLVAHAEVGEGSAARMSYEAAGAQSIAPADARSSLLTDRGTPMGAAGSVVYANVHTGSPGEVTVTAKYRLIPPAASPPPNGSAGWQNRTLIVLPY